MDAWIQFFLHERHKQNLRGNRTFNPGCVGAVRYFSHWPSLCRLDPCSLYGSGSNLAGRTSLRSGNAVYRWLRRGFISKHDFIIHKYINMFFYHEYTHGSDTAGPPSRWDSGRCWVRHTRRHFYTFAGTRLKHGNTPEIWFKWIHPKRQRHKTQTHSRMLHLLPLHPDAQEHVLGPTHFPLFMHMGSHTPGTHCFFSELWAAGHNDLCSNVAGGRLTHSFDTSSPCSPRGRSTRCSSCTDPRSYRENYKRLKHTTTFNWRFQETFALTQLKGSGSRGSWVIQNSYYLVLKLTDLTLGAVEATGTGTEVGPDARSSIQTHGAAQSCRRSDS